MDVTIVYNAHDGENLKGLPHFIVYSLRWMTGIFGPKWFKLSNEIHRVVVPHFTDKGSLESFEQRISSFMHTIHCGIRAIFHSI